MAISCISTTLPGTDAWSNGGYSADQGNPDYGTHDWIVERALDLQTRDVDFLKTAHHTLLLLGTEAPDNPGFIGDTVNHHIYFLQSGELQDDSSADRASDLYQTAIEYLQNGDYEEAAFDIGVMSHYIVDPGVFGHTMGAYTDWGAEIHHSDYEDEFESMIDTIPAPTGVILKDLSAYDAAVELARDTTFGDGAIRSNTWMDANYNWDDDIFADSAMASLAASVEAVAAVINHLMIEAESSNPPPPAEAPDPPSTLTASVVDSEVVLTWTTPPDDGGAEILRYLIYKGDDPEHPLFVDSVSRDVMDWTDDSVHPGETYYYWVVAENSAGSSDLVRMASATIPDDSNVLLLMIVLVVLVTAALIGALVWLRYRRGRAGA